MIQFHAFIYSCRVNCCQKQTRPFRPFQRISRKWGRFQFWKLNCWCALYLMLRYKTFLWFDCSFEASCPTKLCWLSVFSKVFPGLIFELNSQFDFFSFIILGVALCTFTGVIWSPSDLIERFVSLQFSPWGNWPSQSQQWLVKFCFLFWFNVL